MLIPETIRDLDGWKKPKLGEAGEEERARPIPSPGYRRGLGDLECSVESVVGGAVISMRSGLCRERKRNTVPSIQQSDAPEG